MLTSSNSRDFSPKGCPTSSEATLSSLLLDRVGDPAPGCNWGFMLSKWRWRIFSIISRGNCRME
ncbi:hypothetical protein ACS0TY_029284 [Phlomoides rotata]